MWIVSVKTNAGGQRTLRRFKSSARGENAARKSVLRRALAIGCAQFPDAKSVECTIEDIRLDEPSEFRLF